MNCSIIIHTHTYTHTTMTYQMPYRCFLSLHWLVSCTRKTHGGRARYLSASASFHILSVLLIHTQTYLQSRLNIRFQSVCMLLFHLSVFFLFLVRCFGNRLGCYKLWKLRRYHVCLWRRRLAVFRVPLPSQPTKQFSGVPSRSVVPNTVSNHFWIVLGK